MELLFLLRFKNKKTEEKAVKHYALVYIQYIFRQGDKGDDHHKTEEYNVLFPGRFFETICQSSQVNRKPPYTRFKKKTHVFVMCIQAMYEGAVVLFSKV